MKIRSPSRMRCWRGMKREPRKLSIIVRCLIFFHFSAFQSGFAQQDGLSNRCANGLFSAFTLLFGHMHSATYIYNCIIWFISVCNQFVTTEASRQYHNQAACRHNWRNYDRIVRISKKKGGYIFNSPWGLLRINNTPKLKKGTIEEVPWKQEQLFGILNR